MQEMNEASANDTPSRYAALFVELAFSAASPNKRMQLTSRTEAGCARFRARDLHFKSGSQLIRGVGRP
jgi:hypothetical protein